MNSFKRSYLANQLSKVFLAIIVSFLSFNWVFAQGQQKYTVDVSVFITPPYSVYLSDYISRGSNKLTAQLLFNDFNEPSRTVYLKVKIESPNLRITTKDDFIPVKPITVLPGIPYNVTGDELQEYFDFNNIDVSGMSKSDLASSGRLLEGNYTFCFEVYDYRSKEQLSARSCNSANIRLYDAPRLVLPLNETVFPVNVPQNINFQWQLTEAQNIATSYKIHLYELPNVKIDPEIAIGDNQAIKVFESSEVKTTYFLYDASSPLLQRGKKYVWRVQAIQQGNRSEFKNNGYSKAGWFYYGYPEGGSIEVNFPIDGYAFSLRDEKFFRWNAPDNLTKNQQYYYDYKLVAVQPNQTDSDAITNNAAFYTMQSPVLTQTYGYDIIVNKKFESNTTYAWQVKAHTGEQTIASSAVTKFYGPPLLEAFYAGNHVVFINKAQGTLSDLSGEGEVKITSTGVTEKVYFKHITIGKSGALYVLTQGTVKGKYSLPPIGLNAEYSPNGAASFMADSVIITSSGLFLKGYVKWNFPHPTITPNPAFITTKTGIVDYNEFWLLGIMTLSDSLKYQLADPYGFNIEFTAGSDIVLRGRNNFYPRLNGLVTMPQNVKDVIGKTLDLEFQGKFQKFEINLKHKKEILQYIDGNQKDIFTLSEFAGEQGDIEDPSMKGLEGFRQAILKRCEENA